jgi:carboxypeptidase Taq
LLGIEPKREADGVLQDVHWSAGLIGYFPTYTLGNLYSAQIFDAAGRDLGNLEAAFANGEFQPLKTWLVEKIHAKGGLLKPKDLVLEAAGAPPDPVFLVAHLNQKYGEIFNI